MKYGILGDDPKPKRLGDALLEMYVSSVQAFAGDKTLMFMIPHHPTTEAEYFVQYSGFDPDDPTDHATPNVLIGGE